MSCIYCILFIRVFLHRGQHGFVCKVPQKNRYIKAVSGAGVSCTYHNGLVMQIFFKEIYITWTSVVIAVAGIMTALKNELIFIDRLTGLYNRAYLTYLQQEAQKKKSEPIAGIMIDLNGFKQINDNYGHSEGDAALILVADLLRKAFCEYGIVIRYAGDEFVVMLHTTDAQLITDLIARAKDIFEEENKTNDKPFQLSASMGYAISDLSKETIDDFMNRID